MAKKSKKAIVQKPKQPLNGRAGKEESIQKKRSPGAVAGKNPSTLLKKKAAKSSTACTLDKTTGKKKGTLFSSAPVPSKPSHQGPVNVPKKKRKPIPLSTGDAQASPAKHESLDVPIKQAAKEQAGKGPVSHESKRRKVQRASKSLDGNKSKQALEKRTGKTNWELMKDRVAALSDPRPIKENKSPRPNFKKQCKRANHETAGSDHCEKVTLVENQTSADGIHDGILVPKSTNCEVTRVLALDCEMVGVGALEDRKQRDALARATLVRHFFKYHCLISSTCTYIDAQAPLINDHGNVLLDLWVKPREKVTDFRFAVTGITQQDLDKGISFEDASKQISELVQGRILVGHALHNDLKHSLSHFVYSCSFTIRDRAMLQVLALEQVVSKYNVRDTALYPPLMRASRHGKLFNQALRHVVLAELGIAIQKGEHDPAQDARAALYLYHKYRDVWELSIKAGTLRAPGVRTSAKLTKRDKRQRRMHVRDYTMHPNQKPPVSSGPLVSRSGEVSDDEFAPPTISTIAKMNDILKRNVYEDEMADY